MLLLRDLLAVEAGQVRDHLHRGRAADGQQQVQYAAAAAPAAVRPAAVAEAQLMLDLVRALPFQFAQVDGGAGGKQTTVRHRKRVTDRHHGLLRNAGREPSREVAASHIIITVMLPTYGFIIITYG